MVTSASLRMGVGLGEPAGTNVVGELRSERFGEGTIGPADLGDIDAGGDAEGFTQAGELGDGPV